MLPYQCITCGRYFPKMLDYYRHRVGVGAASRCMTEGEMFIERVRTCAPPQAVAAAPVERRQRQEAPARMTPMVMHARWLLQRGMRPAELLKHGIGEDHVKKAIECMEREMLEECPAPPPSAQARRGGAS